jgi:integrase
MEEAVVLDARGYRRSRATVAGFHAGRPPRNRRYPADPPTTDEIVRLIRGCAATPSGVRLRALVVVLCRSGLRISEALALEERDLDPTSGSITVRRGKKAADAFRG